MRFVILLKSPSWPDSNCTSSIGLRPPSSPPKRGALGSILNTLITGSLALLEALYGNQPSRHPDMVYRNNLPLYMCHLSCFNFLYLSFQFCRRTVVCLDKHNSAYNRHGPDEKQCDSNGHIIRKRTGYLFRFSVLNPKTCSFGYSVIYGFLRKSIEKKKPSDSSTHCQ